MINLLNDIVSVENDKVAFPFSLQYENLQDTSYQIELLIPGVDSYTVSPNSLFVIEDDGSDGNIIDINPTIFKNIFMVRLNLLGIDIENCYIRLYNERYSYISNKINISKSDTIEFITPAQELNFRPKVVSLSDHIECTFNKALVALTKDKFDIVISVSNNIGSTIPVWEDMTECYLSGTEFEIKNTVKDNNRKWSISVMYKIKKRIVDSTVEISDIKLLVF